MTEKLQKSVLVPFIVVLIFANVSISRSNEPTEHGLIRGSIKLLSCDAKWNIRSTAFSPDNKYLLSSWSLGEARLWNVATGELLKSFFMSPEYEITDVAFSPSGETIATANAHE